MMTGGNKKHDTKNILAVVKGDERYIFIYDFAGEQELLRTLGKYASDPSLSFNWLDAAIVSNRVREIRDQGNFNCEGR